jgi:hypothetical protein
MRRKQSFGAKQQICRVLTRKLSFNFCGARAHRDPEKTFTRGKVERIQPTP